MPYRLRRRTAAQRRRSVKIWSRSRCPSWHRVHVEARSGPEVAWPGEFEARAVKGRPHGRARSRRGRSHRDPGLPERNQIDTDLIHSRKTAQLLNCCDQATHAGQAAHTVGRNFQHRHPPSLNGPNGGSPCACNRCGFGQDRSKACPASEVLTKPWPKVSQFFMPSGEPSLVCSVLPVPRSLPCGPYSLTSSASPCSPTE